MAKVTVTTPNEFCAKLSRLEVNQRGIAGKAIYKGAKIIADQISANLRAVPVDTFRYLRDGDQYTSATAEEIGGLLNCFGIADMQDDDDGYNVKCGFHDYIENDLRHWTPQYPRGVPAAMLARSIESGASARKKHPFVRPAISKTKEAAKKAMAQVIEEETTKIIGGN
ncbi:MAG: HK97 gp10 family phage protein [Oscillospiraceae bacterium]